jgi:hypothetical protein
MLARYDAVYKRPLDSGLPIGGFFYLQMGPDTLQLRMTA